MTLTFSLSRNKCLVLWKERERITACPTGLGVRRAHQAEALKTQLFCLELHQWVLPKPLRAAGNVIVEDANLETCCFLKIITQGRL